MWNIANVLTMVRIALVPVFVWLFLQGNDGTRLAATIVFSIAAITDKIDGDLARSRNLVTNFGKIADPIADKALVISAFVMLSSAGAMPWWVTIVIVVRELGITLLRFVMIRRSVMAASKGGKLKTVLQMTFIIGLLMPWHLFLPGGVIARVLAEVPLVAGARDLRAHRGTARTLEVFEFRAGGVERLLGQPDTLLFSNGILDTGFLLVVTYDGFIRGNNDRSCVTIDINRLLQPWHQGFNIHANQRRNVE